MRLAVDDIVTSLQASAEWMREMEHESWFDTAKLMSDAADEIMRLRAAGDALIAAIRNHDLREQHIKAWEEARRG